MQFRGKTVEKAVKFEGQAVPLCIFSFFCTKKRFLIWQYRTIPHFHFSLRGSILVSAKEVSSTMLECHDLMEMQRWGAEERKIVAGVKTLIQFLFRS